MVFKDHCTKIRLLFFFLCLGIFSSAYSADPDITEYDAEFLDEEVRKQRSSASAYTDLLIREIEKEVGELRGVVELKDEFVLKSVEIINNSVISDDELKVAFERYLNTRVQFIHLQDIADVISYIYQTKGYFLSFALVPTQKVVDGKLKVIVIEGIIDDVFVADKTPEETSPLLLKYAEEVIKEQPLTRKTYSKFLNRAEELPGITIKPNLVPSKDTIGASSLVLSVKETYLKGSLSVMSHISDRFGRHLDVANLTYNSMIMSSRTRMSLIRSDLTKPNRLFVGSIEHKHFIGEKRAYLKGEYSSTLSKPYFGRANIDSRDYTGRGETGSLYYTYPIFDRFDKEWNLKAGFQAKNSFTKYDHLLRSRDKVRNFVAEVIWINRNFNPFKSIASELKLNLRYVHGIYGLGASNPSDGTPLSVSDGKINSRRLKFDGGWLQPIGLSGYYLDFHVTGQKAFDRLLNSGKFSFGGAQFGRGYKGSVISGDSGLAGVLEINYFKPELWKFDYAQAFISSDMGKAWKKKSLSSTAKRAESAMSAAAGIRLGLFKHVYLSTYVSRPLTHKDGADSRTTRIYYLLNFSL